MLPLPSADCVAVGKTEPKPRRSSNSHTRTFPHSHQRSGTRSRTCRSPSRSRTRLSISHARRSNNDRRRRRIPRIPSAWVHCCKMEVPRIRPRWVFRSCWRMRVPPWGRKRSRMSGGGKRRRASCSICFSGSRGIHKVRSPIVRISHSSGVSRVAFESPDPSR